MKTTVAGRDIEYGVDEKTGVFGATWNGEKYSHVTLAGLKGALELQMKKKPLAVRVIKIENHWRDEDMEITKGTIVGIHSGNNNLLIRWDGVKHTEQSRHGRLIKANVDVAKLKALHAAQGKASKAMEDFLEKNEFDTQKLREEFSKGE